ncbi:hypothetical protein EDC04DRAFT_1263242 [Pisolithus marmoratus]|nr:hypothetical protein EDC04DRAFT_1263242 [Pisolithus marmoratus]
MVTTSISLENCTSTGFTYITPPFISITDIYHFYFLFASLLCLSLLPFFSAERIPRTTVGLLSCHPIVVNIPSVSRSLSHCLHPALRSMAIFSTRLARHPILPPPFDCPHLLSLSYSYPRGSPTLFSSLLTAAVLRIGKLLTFAPLHDLSTLRRDVYIPHSTLDYLYILWIFPSFEPTLVILRRVVISLRRPERHCNTADVVERGWTLNVERAGSQCNDVCMANHGIHFFLRFPSRNFACAAGNGGQTGAKRRTPGLG